MVYDEAHFSGKERKRALAAFPGKIETIRKQPSGNTVVSLVRTNQEGGVHKRDAIFKLTEMEAHGLNEVIVAGKSLIVYGIAAKTGVIFPVCFVKVKDEAGFTRVDLPENEGQYQVAIKQQDKGQQKALSDYSPP